MPIFWMAYFGCLRCDSSTAEALLMRCLQLDARDGDGDEKEVCQVAAEQDLALLYNSPQLIHKMSLFLQSAYYLTLADAAR